MPGYNFHKYPLPTILTRVFCEAFVDHNSVAENDVVHHRDGLNIPGSQLLQFVGVDVHDLGNGCATC